MSNETTGRGTRRLLPTPGEIDRWRWILETPPGARPLAPTFGCRANEVESLDDPVSRRLAGDLIEDALRLWSPMSRVRSVRVEPLAAGSHRRRLRVTVLLPGRSEQLDIELDPPTRSRRSSASGSEASSPGTHVRPGASGVEKLERA